jgi:hypothetical protein
VDVGDAVGQAAGRLGLEGCVGARLAGVGEGVGEGALQGERVGGLPQLPGGPPPPVTGDVVTEGRTPAVIQPERGQPSGGDRAAVHVDRAHQHPSAGCDVVQLTGGQQPALRPPPARHAPNQQPRDLRLGRGRGDPDRVQRVG